MNGLLGYSDFRSESQVLNTLPVESSILAGGDISLVATGNATDQQGDITISGAAVTAGGQLSLQANNDIVLLAAKGTNLSESREKSFSASHGISFSKDGLSATVAANRMRGFTNGHGITYYPVALTAGLTDSSGQLSLSAGTD